LRFLLCLLSCRESYRYMMPQQLKHRPEYGTGGMLHYQKEI